MKKSILILFILTMNNLFAGDGGSSIQLTDISGPTSFVQQAFDVINYDAVIDLTNAPALDMKGICKISIEWLDSPADNKFYFHLRSLKIDSAFYQNIKVTPVEIGDESSPTYHYEITPPPQLSTSSATVTIYYGGTMTAEPDAHEFVFGGVQASGSILYAMGVGFYNNYVSATQHWLPCYDHPSDKATFHCKFIVKPGKVVASNGTLNRIYPDNGTDIFEWTHDIPCATYNYTFAVDDYTTVNIPGGNKPTVIYCRPADTTVSKFMFKLVPRMVEAFEKRFGDYPFEKVGYCLTPIGSMEHETMISFARRIVTQGYTWRDSLNITAAHELAHQWFGDKVTCRDFSDAWLNEGFATFCESIWIEEMFDFPTFLNYQNTKIQNYISKISKEDGILSLFDFSREFPSSNYPTTIYYKGAAVVGMLRYELGDSLFFGACREYLNKLAFGTATTEDLKQIFEEHSGKDLDWFFAQWIYGKGWPQLEIKVERNVAYPTPSDNSTTIYIDQVQQTDWGSYTNLPVEMELFYSNGTSEYIVGKIKNKSDRILIDDLLVDSIKVNNGPSLRALLEVKSIEYTTSVKDGNIFSLKCYPNPATDKLTIEFDAIAGTASIKLINPLGLQVYSNTLQTADGKNSYIINTAKLSSGMYMLKVEAGSIAEFISIRVIH